MWVPEAVFALNAHNISKKQHEVWCGLPVPLLPFSFQHFLLQVHTLGSSWGCSPFLGHPASPQWRSMDTSCTASEQLCLGPRALLSRSSPSALCPTSPISEGVSPSSLHPPQAGSSPGGSPSFYLRLLNALLRKISGTRRGRGR